MATYTFQEGVDSGYGAYAGTRDAWLRQNSPDSNRAHWDHFFLSNVSGADLDIGLIRFEDIFDTDGGPIPAGSQITSATLTLFFKDRAFDSRAHVFETVNEWEGYDSSTGETFNSFSLSGGSTSSGIQPEQYGDFVGSLATCTGYNSIDVTKSIQKWVTGTDDKTTGWIIFGSDTDTAVVCSSADDTPDSYVIAERAAEGATFIPSGGVDLIHPKLTVVVDEGAAVPGLVRHPYMQIVTDTTAHIRWMTTEPCDSRVRYGSAYASLDSTVSTADLVTDHDVTITGLTANTTYYYDVGTTTYSMAGGDADHEFKTAPTLGATSSFTLWTTGDAGTGYQSQFFVAESIEKGLGDNPSDMPDLHLYLGDIYPEGLKDTLTDHYFQMYRSILRSCPAYPTLGAHENISGARTIDGVDSGPWYEAFTFPPNMEHGYYSFNYGNAHFVCLNPNELIDGGSDQLAWLDADLAAIPASIDWLIGYCAYPPYSRGTHDSTVAGTEGTMESLREDGAIEKLEAAGMDIFLAGHSHGYERSYMVHGCYEDDDDTTWPGTQVHTHDGDATAYTKDAGLNAADANNGCVYIVAGNGGMSAGSANHDHPIMISNQDLTASSGDEYLGFGSVFITINDDTLTCKHVIAVTDETHDEFSIVKS